MTKDKMTKVSRSSPPNDSEIVESETKNIRFDENTWNNIYIFIYIYIYVCIYINYIYRYRYRYRYIHTYLLVMHMHIKITVTNIATVAAPIKK